MVDIGRKFEMLTVLAIEKERSSDGHILVRCLCDCGKEATKTWTRVKYGRVTSCGCKNQTNIKAITHGMKYSKEYESWSGAKQRCLCKTNKEYRRYGGAGVIFHSPWVDSFELFFEHMGYRPAGTTLDRIDNNLGYIPGNCRWATSSEQNTNKKNSYIITIEGIDFNSYTEAGKHFGVSRQTIFKWVNGCQDKRRNKTRRVKDGCSKKLRY